MASKPKKEILQKVGIQKPDNMVSLLNFSLGKEGFFRANLNGVRVGRSCRTVITPNPYINCNEVVCPQTIAEIITVPVHVNSQNINQLYSLIQNYPNYPCAIQINNNKYISEKNKSQCVIIPGDIIYRQVIDGDLCLTNRYPSVREESFGGAKVKVVQNQQSIQFNLSVIDKFNADFDGDEMQLFFTAKTSNNIEIALLSSVYQQFLEYISCQNVVGGAKDLKAGIYNIKTFKDHEDILNQAIDFIDAYFDDDITIENHKLTNFSSALAEDHSNFLTYIAFKYGTAYAVSIIDIVIKICYLVNEKYNYSLYYDIFNTTSPQQQKYEKERITKATELLEKYYTNKFISPLGVSRQRFFNIYLQSQLTINQLAQNQILLQQYTKPDDKYIQLYQKDIDKNKVAYHNALISIGYCNDGEGNNMISQPRLICAYPKFSDNILNQGYITENYIDGISQTSQFLIAFEGRRQAYVKGNVIRDSGYMQRRIQKAFDNVYCGQNQVIFGNNDTIINFQFGSQSYDSRYNIVKTVKYNSEWNSQQKEIFQYFVNMNNQLSNNQLQNTTQEDITQATVEFVLPFDISLSNISISKKDLQYILSYRITNQMSDTFKEIIYQQQFPVFAYLYLTCFKDTSNKDTSTKNTSTKNTSSIQIPEIFTKAILSAGDSIGIKAAMAITGPLSQDTLDAIHHTQSTSGRIQYIEEDKLQDSQRFLELTQSNNQYTQFKGYLLTPDNEDLATKFIQKYQTLYLHKLEPFIDIYYYQKQYNFDIIFTFDNLSYNNVDILQLITSLQEFLENKKLDILLQQEILTLRFYFSTQTKQETLLQYRTELLTTYLFGSGILYNIYYKQENKIYSINGNVFPGHEIELYSIQEINPFNLYVSSIPFFNEHFSIFTTEQQLYNQYNTTINNISVTKGTNKGFIQLFSSFQTQSGKYTGFQRFDYKKDSNRDFIQNIIYEEGASFVINAVQKQQWYNTKSYQNTEIFGTNGESGTNISEYFSEYIE